MGGAKGVGKGAKGTSRARLLASQSSLILSGGNNQQKTLADENAELRRENEKLRREAQSRKEQRDGYSKKYTECKARYDESMKTVWQYKDDLPEELLVKLKSLSSKNGGAPAMTGGQTGEKAAAASREIKAGTTEEQQPLPLEDKPLPEQKSRAQSAAAAGAGNYDEPASCSMRSVWFEGPSKSRASSCWPRGAGEQHLRGENLSTGSAALSSASGALVLAGSAPSEDTRSKEDELTDFFESLYQEARGMREEKLPGGASSSASNVKTTSTAGSCSSSFATTGSKRRRLDQQQEEDERLFGRDETETALVLVDPHQQKTILNKGTSAANTSTKTKRHVLDLPNLVRSFRDIDAITLLDALREEAVYQWWTKASDDDQTLAEGVGGTTGGERADSEFNLPVARDEEQFPNREGYMHMLIARAFVALECARIHRLIACADANRNNKEEEEHADYSSKNCIASRIFIYNGRSPLFWPVFFWAFFGLLFSLPPELQGLPP
eukprot:g1544.t1